MERIGLLGGSFDPPHIGHLWLGEAARQQLGLDRVLFAPAGQPPHKEAADLSPSNHRRAMTELATAGNPSFQVDDTDLTRPGPHYTVDLLALLRRRFEGAQWWLLVGSDSLRDLPTWRHPERLIERCRLGVLPRPEADAYMPALDQQIPGLKASVDWLSGPVLMLSSSLLRQLVRDGRSVRYLVPDSVAGYINRHQLYRSSTS